MSKVNELLSDLESAWMVSFSEDGYNMKLRGCDTKYTRDIIQAGISLYYAAVNIPKTPIPERDAYVVDAISISNIQKACHDFYNAMEPDANKEEP